jgi:predicted GTPase
MERLRAIAEPRDPRGSRPRALDRIELDRSARPYCEALKDEGVLCKETHDRVIRIAPPLVIDDDEASTGPSSDSRRCAPGLSSRGSITMTRIKTVIMGAAGRDFHNFNVVYRDDERYDVVAFTAAQIPNIAGRRYPAALAGRLYPTASRSCSRRARALIAQRGVQDVVSLQRRLVRHVMTGARSPTPRGPTSAARGAPTMLASTKPVMAVCAVRTGSGKSQTTRRVAARLRRPGLRVAAVRHPMPYGDLAAQRVQRFASLDDLARTVHDRGDGGVRAAHRRPGTIVYAGVDYGAILEQAAGRGRRRPLGRRQQRPAVLPPDLHIVVADPLRVGNELATTRRGQPADGRRGDHQQDRQRRRPRR